MNATSTPAVNHPVNLPQGFYLTHSDFLANLFAILQNFKNKHAKTDAIIL